MVGHPACQTSIRIPVRNRGFAHEGSSDEDGIVVYPLSKNRVMPRVDLFQDGELSELSEDEASYAKELDDLRASHMNALRDLEMELRASFDAAQKALEGDHARVSAAKQKYSDEAERMRLERDAADSRLKELEEKARLAKLHLEETRNRHANEDAALTKRLDEREKASIKA